MIYFSSNTIFSNNGISSNILTIKNSNNRVKPVTYLQSTFFLLHIPKKSARPSDPASQIFQIPIMSSPKYLRNRTRSADARRHHFLPQPQAQLSHTRADAAGSWPLGVSAPSRKTFGVLPRGVEGQFPARAGGD